MSIRKKYTTAKGKVFDMQMFAQENSKTVSVGNLGGKGKITNARGDILGSGGKSVVIKRDDIVRKYYKEGLPKVEQKSIKEDVTKSLVTPVTKKTDNFLSPADALKAIQEEKSNQEAVSAKKKSKK